MLYRNIRSMKAELHLFYTSVVVVSGHITSNDDNQQSPIPSHILLSDLSCLISKSCKKSNLNYS